VRRLSLGPICLPAAVVVTVAFCDLVQGGQDTIVSLIESSIYVLPRVEILRLQEEKSILLDSLEQV
jgi:hypothetical protein